ILFVQMWMVHSYALSLPGYGFKDSVRVAAPVAVVAPAPLAQ
ncbi:light-harvesting protein, partial [Thiocystis minor]|nr:light-harvesting protein [Thiocystis minor]